MDSVRRIGVVTVTYNSAEVLPEFLDSAVKQTFRDFTLYVIDNASQDKSLEIASAYRDPRIRIIENTENLGVAEGNNQGILVALAENCDAVLLLNNDTAFGDELFAELTAGLDRCDCDMTTGKMYYYDLPDRIWCAGGRFQPWLGYRVHHDGENRKDVGQYDQPRRITYTPTCCLLVRRVVFDKVGLMDNRYFVYSDDVDFLYRCLKKGISLWYVPQAKLWHKVNSLTGTMSDFMVRYCTRNRAYFLLKHLPRHVAEIWIRIYTSVYISRFLLHKDSRSTLHLKLTSVAEGRRMNNLD